ncbi:MAG: hypothetical protein QMD80_00405 [archaeon]|nr:hypothetical protein [archaeon]
MKGEVGKEQATLAMMVNRIATFVASSIVMARQVKLKLESMLKGATGEMKETLTEFLLDSEELLERFSNEIMAKVLKISRSGGVLIEGVRMGIRNREQLLKLIERLAQFYREIVHYTLRKVGRGVYRKILELSEEIKERSKEEELVTPELVEGIIKEIEEGEEILKEEGKEKRKEEVIEV